MNIIRQSCKLLSQGYSKGIIVGTIRKTKSTNLLSIHTACSKSVHTTARVCDLMEFFDDEKNWGNESVKVGRAWRKEELRIKSNSDLHKLWFILLKERNMLMSMEHEHKEAYEAFPNPERLDKVKESMHNLEEVVIERNKAYHELETGDSGMRPAKEVVNQIGIPYFHKMTEHLIPKHINKKWNETHVFYDNYYETRLFHALLGEKNIRREKRHKRDVEQHILGLMRRFPNLDLEAVKEQFPEADVDKLKDSDKARGHWLP